MSINLKKFESQLPDFFSSLYSLLTSHGFIPTFVGGVVRDFVLDGKIEYDWDIELSHDALSFNKDHWKSFGKELQKFGKTTFLTYDIIRVDGPKFQIEFSPPRREVFEDQLSHLGHRNFSVVFDFQMPFEEAVRRRDFTINAMGIRIKNKELSFLDPLDGLTHLRQKVLHPCGKDFSRDPVRFLRALRFAQNFKYDFSEELRTVLKTMNTEGLSASYLWSEMQKSSSPIDFYLGLVQNQQDHPELRLPIGEELLPHKHVFKEILIDPSHHELWMIALVWVGLSCEEWQKFFAQSSESCRRLSRWAEDTKKFVNILPETFHGEFDAQIKTPQFDHLFDWYYTTKQLLQKNPDLPLLSMIEKFLPDWIHLFRFEAVRDVKHIDPPLRAKYQLWNLCQRL